MSYDVIRAVNRSVQSDCSPHLCFAQSYGNIFCVHGLHFSETGNRTVEIKTVVEEVENLTHFSTYALSATNGTVRWHHLPGDFGQLTHNIKVCMAVLLQFPCLKCCDVMNLH